VPPTIDETIEDQTVEDQTDKTLKTAVGVTPRGYVSRPKISTLSYRPSPVATTYRPSPVATAAPFTAHDPLEERHDPLEEANSRIWPTFPAKTRVRMQRTTRMCSRTFAASSG